MIKAISPILFAGSLAVSAQPRAASLLGDVGFTSVSGTVSTGVATPYTLPAGENIYGPFEAGFSSAQDFILEALGCADGALGHVPGGVDTATAEQMVAAQCGITLPRFENNRRISLLDDCGGHTYAYHFHERLRCLYEDVGAHAPKVGEGYDGKNLYGKWEDAATRRVPLLDACGGHYGPTPESDVPVYHYHVQDQAPFTFGCFGPNADDSLVTVEQCRALYPGCNGQATLLSTGVEYELWCPCFDADGSNHHTAPLPVFTSGQVTTVIAPSTPVTTNPIQPTQPTQPTLAAAVVGAGYCASGFSSGSYQSSASACEAACTAAASCTHFAFCPAGTSCPGFHANYCGLYTGAGCPLTSALGGGYTAYRSSVDSGSIPVPSTPTVPSIPTAPVAPRPGRFGRPGRFRTGR